MASTLVLTLAISAGVHGALTPDHVHESAGAGGGFLAATLVLAALALAFTARPTAAAARAAALVFGCLIGSYALAVTTGVPLLHPEVEAVDALAVVTKAVEAVGLVAAVSLARQTSKTRHVHVLRPKGANT